MTKVVVGWKRGRQRPISKIDALQHVVDVGSNDMKTSSLQWQDRTQDWPAKTTAKSAEDLHDPRHSKSLASRDLSVRPARGDGENKSLVHSAAHHDGSKMHRHRQPTH
jgi:hypothetical protein